MYRPFGKHSQLKSLYKRFLYVAVIKPIQTYGMWGFVRKSNIEIIQHYQSIDYRTIGAVYQFDWNDIIRPGLNLNFC